MALNRFSAKVVSRSNGHSAIKGATYNARTRLKDDRTGDITDYRSKGGLEWEGIFTPKNAPSWAKDRERLWNEVEKREDQSNHRDRAQIARSFILSLPHELTAEQRLWIVKDFAREMARKGMVVDACIHKPHAKDRKEHDRSLHNDERNFHVHMLVTMRELNENGFGNKVREWNNRSEIERLRERWSEMGAKALHRAGFHLEAERYAVGHHTLKIQRALATERGDTEYAKELDREPQRSLGPRAAAMERRGIRTVNGDLNRDIEERNFGRNVTKDLGREMTNGKHAHPMLKRSMVKGLEVVLDGAAGLLDSLVSPKLTPEQQRHADEAYVQRQLDDNDANLRRNQERGRDR